MEKEVIEELIKVLKPKNSKISSLEITKQGYKPIPIKPEYFYKITDNLSRKKICFIDGGNASILQASSFSLDFVRIYCSIFENNKKIDFKTTQFFNLVKAEKINKNICFMAKPFTKLFDQQFFDLNDKTLMTGQNQVNINNISNVIRRFSEISFANNLIDSLDSGDIIVFDGTLESKYTNELIFWENLFDKAIKKEVLIISLAKTCSLLTDNALPITSCLQTLTDLNEWYYHPILEVNNEKHKAEIYFTKLNKSSKHCFRVEIFNKQSKIMDVNKLFFVLAQNSKDISFPGYPYGLIDADKFARISNQEQSLLRSKAIFLLKKNFKDLEKDISSINSHEILDSIN